MYLIYLFALNFLNFVPVNVHGGVTIVQVFSYTIVDKACNAPNVVLVVVATWDLVNTIA